MVKKQNKAWLVFVFLQFHLSPFLAYEYRTDALRTRTPSPSNAYLALQSWKSAIISDPFGVTTTWVGPNVCTYKGVFCSSSIPMASDQVVFSIDLNHAQLGGTLVQELSYLADLSILHLNSNNFSGSIPDTFSDLINLTELDLSNNQFSGPFPSVVLRLPRLVFLDLRYNRFSGAIPYELFALGLDAIFLNDNEFAGQIPMSLGSSFASVINLANNNFSGSLPTNFGYIGSRLREILFFNNEFTGCIPEGVGLFTQMVVLDLSFNSLRGELPSSLACLSGIEVLNVAHNEFFGFLPDVLCSIKSLFNLTVSYNFFSGVSQECSRLGYRNVGFDVTGNCISGRKMQRPLPECAGFEGEFSCIRVPSADLPPSLCRALVQENFMNPGTDLPPYFSSP
ncbi:leucine-rich repeat extensin-like protein 4 [Nymphaea colorata]|uniref:Cell wall hydroxyproline-rich glycoprotein n=1 Tax=Nymphaea colorata TaxID=210225 RepID=A0A5K1E7S6_9MAGN|nr:leucine-rich repeat extensin-like protein 4 [Nymphaea colorata]